MSDPALRVLIADDQLTFRSAMRVTLDKIPWVEVVGVANNGKQAVEMTGELKPDVVALDVEMPVMNGIEALQLIRKREPRTSVIMVSAFTQEGAAVTIEAMSLGARDFIAKPDSNSHAENQRVLREELEEKLRVMQMINRAKPRPQVRSAPESLDLSAVPQGRVHTIAIASSSGGPAALRTLFTNIREPLPVPILLVQHMPEKFTAALAESLNKLGPTQVKEAAEGDIVQPGHAYLAPGGLHMTVKRGARGTAIHLLNTEKEHHCRPAADVLFRSVAEVYAGSALGVVLTGMGKDGALGLGQMKAKGAVAFAESEDTCSVYGMPGEAVRQGVIDRSYPINHMAEAITKAVTK